MFKFIFTPDLIEYASVAEIERFCNTYPVSLQILDNGGFVLVDDPIREKEQKRCL